MSLAGRELGDDALLVYSREAAVEAKYLGSYEVVFAIDAKEAATDGALSPSTPVNDVGSTKAPPPAGNDQVGWASSALADLRNEIGNLRQDVALHRRRMEDLLTATDRRAWRMLADWGEEPELLPGVSLAGRLLQSDMDPEHVLDVIECTRDAVRSDAGGSDDGGGVWKRLLERELIDRRRCDSRLDSYGKSAAIVLIGPPGAGRTTVAMQLAAHASSRGLDPRLIAFEPGRLTASQALRSYAGVLGAKFDLTRRAEHLNKLFADRPAGLTIIDGPGLGPLSDDGTTQLTALCSQQRAFETWLVLPATLRASDLHLLIRRFSVYAPSRLIFTRTGEARHWGAIWSTAEWADLALGFFCDGPRIPDDLKPATGATLAGNTLGAAAADFEDNLKSSRSKTNRTSAGGRGQAKQ